MRVPQEAECRTTRRQRGRDFGRSHHGRPSRKHGARGFSPAWDIARGHHRPRDPQSYRKEQVDERFSEGCSRPGSQWISEETGQFRGALCRSVRHSTLGNTGRSRLRTHTSRFYAYRRTTGRICLLRCGQRPARLEDHDAGLYGQSVAVHKVSTNPLPYADYMANLAVVFADSVVDLGEVSAAELYRVTRPYGGVAVIACPDDLRPRVEQWLTSAGIPRNEWERVDLGYRIQRGKLPGAGAWTHQYADVGRSGASNDRRVRLPLKVLWFGGLGPADIVSRHYRAPTPLAVNGYLFVAKLSVQLNAGWKAALPEGIVNHSDNPNI